MKKHVVDASTIIAFLGNETGAEIAREYCRGSLLSAVNYTEVLQDARKRDSLKLAQAIIHHMQIDVVPFDSHRAAATAELHPLTAGKNISLADRACLSLGLQEGLPVVTADKKWRELGVDVELIVFRERFVQG